MTRTRQTEASYNRLPDESPPPPAGCPVNDFTPFAPDYLADPYSVLAGLRDETPVFYSSKPGYLVLTRMEDLAAVFLDHETSGSQNVQERIPSLRLVEGQSLERFPNMTAGCWSPGTPEMPETAPINQPTRTEGHI